MTARRNLYDPMTPCASQMISLNDLQRHSSAIADELAAAISRVTESGWYVLGKEVASFEQEFAQYCGATQCVGVGNGTDALELAMRAVGVKPGTKVVTVANAGMYSGIAIAAIGVEPLYVDIDPRSMLMSPQKLCRLDLSGVSAIVATHLYGRLADIEAIVAIADERGIPVIEDCAQSHGATRSGKRAGAFGAIGCFSFYPTKNLGALGDGGAIVTNDAMLAERIRQLRQYGWSTKYVSTLPGGRNSRLDEIQAAILRVKLPYLDKWNARRREIAALYLARIRHPDVVIDRSPDASDVVHLFIVRTNRRDSLARHCRQQGIATDVHYPLPDYLQPIMEGKAPGIALAETGRACDEVLTLPCFPEMLDGEVAVVAEAINDWRP